MADLSSRRILVTGAAGGIGLATSRRLLAAGATVLMCDRHAGRLEAARAGLCEAGGIVETIVADLTDAGAIEHIAAEAGVTDGLVNCAGIYPNTPALDLTVAEWDSVMSLNLRAPFLLTMALAKRMIAAGRGGSIVNISSTASVLARPGIAHYGASKAGLNQLTRVLAVELAPHGIRVNAVLPGVIATETVTQSLAEAAARAEMRAKEARIPLRRLGTPEEIAELTAFLLSDAASYSTGSLFTADGGYSLGIVSYD
jgi:NAD(P)-dependent dehydrogenase (short-subunit alcohol dehydrogenase family)